jgi:hypothetical protein
MELCREPITVSFFLTFNLSNSHVNSSCLAHVINLGNVDFMSRITKIAAVETATAIWEYDPTLQDNRVLGGSLDVIAAIRTLAIKV